LNSSYFITPSQVKVPHSDRIDQHSDHTFVLCAVSSSFDEPFLVRGIQCVHLGVCLSVFIFMHFRVQFQQHLSSEVRSLISTFSLLSVNQPYIHQLFNLF
jgi:hypothetical protein